MSISRQIEKVRGQALVELAVILPVLILFMSVAIPLIVNGFVSSWLDERLALRLLDPDEERIHSALERTHDSDLLPPYFKDTAFEESTRTSTMGISLPIPGHIFPGDVIRKISTATLPESKWWNRRLLGDRQEQDRRVSGDLSIVAARVPVESNVPGEVRRLTILGFASGKTQILERSGFDLFHINLDALPEAGQKGGKI